MDSFSQHLASSDTPVATGEGVALVLLRSALFYFLYFPFISNKSKQSTKF
jgi:hypothetical protein